MKTPATQFLHEHGVHYTEHEYEWRAARLARARRQS